MKFKIYAEIKYTRKRVLKTEGDINGKKLYIDFLF